MYPPLSLSLSFIWYAQCGSLLTLVQVSFDTSIGLFWPQLHLVCTALPSRTSSTLGSSFTCLSRILCRQGLGFRVQGLGFRVQGLGFRVQLLHLPFQNSVQVGRSRSGLVTFIYIRFRYLYPYLNPGSLGFRSIPSGLGTYIYISGLATYLFLKTQVQVPGGAGPSVG